MMARSLACLASLGRCGPSSIPGTADWIGLNGPLLAWPGLGSNVSVWLGPPDIQSRMHDLRRLGCAAVSAARASIQPEAEAPRAPAAVEPHHLPSGQLRGTWRFRRLMATLPCAREALVRRLSDKTRQVHAVDRSIRAARSRPMPDTGRLNGSGGTPARSGWPRRCRRVLSPVSSAVFLRSTNRNQDRQLVGPSAGGSESRDKGFRSGPACPGTGP